MQGESESPLQLKSREVSSRFLSPTSSFPTRAGIPSPNRAHSPSLKKNASVREQKQRRGVDEVGSMRGGLWPSAVSNSSSTSASAASEKMAVSTLADHLGNERLMDLVERKEMSKSSFTRQKSCSEFSRFDVEKKKDKEIKENTKENRPIGGSMRYASNFQIPAASPSVSLTPRRLSVDENILDGKPPRRKSDTFCDVPSSESEGSEIFSGTDFESPPYGKRSRKSGVKVPSRFMNRKRRGSDSAESSPNNSSVTKTVIKRANSLTAYGSSMSQWALAPGRTSSSPISAESDGKQIQSYSRLSPMRSKTKGTVGSFFSLGLDLLKGKKSSNSSLSNDEVREIAHKLRLLHNRLLQWRFANAKAEFINTSKRNEAERSLLNAWLDLSKLQSSVVQKRMQFEKETLDLKINNILGSQTKPLETWAQMEREHLSAVAVIKDCLHAVLCRVPLIEGAKVDFQQAYIALHHASDLSMSINTTMNNFSSMAEKTVPLFSELAEIVARERCLLQECHELLDVFANHELQEKSLRSQIIQLKS
ncbi:QWRF motif-containing protein 3-like [Aristolochia californica]|uniref:QWRF motif-containing protein 3-like n=1 Tax=Aristolochia californica TaxID=171875 RepID=UPI0035D9E6C8